MRAESTGYIFGIARRSLVAMAILIGSAACEAPSSVPQASPAPETATAFTKIEDCSALPELPEASCPASAPADRQELEIARLDFDADGTSDLALRKRSALDCGSAGCTTAIFVTDAGQLRLVKDDLVTDGAIAACLTSSDALGVRFPQVGENAPCLPLHDNE